MIYITFSLNPRPCISVSDEILPPVIDFKILFVTWADWGFFVFAATVANISGVTNFTPGLKKLSQAFFVPLKIFCSLLFIDPPSSTYWWGVKIMIFWQLYLGLGHLSWSFIILPLLFKSHHAEFDTDEQWTFFHFLLSIKASRLVTYSVKNCDLLRP